jgi:DNA-directed RNA polymerase specialized sigma24 family protein
MRVTGARIETPARRQAQPRKGGVIVAWMSVGDRDDEDPKHTGTTAEAQSHPSLEDGPVASSPEPQNHHPDPPPAETGGVPAPIVRAYLAQRETTRELRKRVRRRVKSADLAADLAQAALTEALAAADRTPPRTAESMPGWVGIIADRKVAEHYKVRARRAPYEGTVEDVDEVAVEPEGPGGVIDWTLTGWLHKQVDGSPRDEELLDILKDKAINEKTWEQIAGERDVTQRALWNRVARFKKKYEPRWRKYRAMLIAGTLLFIALICLAAYLIAQGLLSPLESPRDRIGPDRVSPIPSAAPSSTVAPPPRVLEPATGPSADPDNKTKK